MNRYIIITVNKLKGREYYDNEYGSHTLLSKSNKGEIDLQQLQAAGTLSVSELNIIQEIVQNTDKADVIQTSSTWLPR